MVIKNSSIITREHLEEAKENAYSILDNLDSSLLYHNKEHTTESVVPSSEKLSELEKLSKEDKVLIGIAAAFHDTGHIKKYNANETIGAKFAEEYMKKSKNRYDENNIRIIKNSIKNTDMQNPPETIHEKILRDADLSYLGSNKEKFIDLNERLRKESKKHPESPLHKASLNKKSWGESSLKFISEFHQWFTESAKDLYGKQKQENIEYLKDYYKIR